MPQWLHKIIISPSKTFLTFCFCFIAGSSIASLFTVSPGVAVYLYTSLFIFIAALILIWSHRTYRFVTFCFLFCILGVWRYAVTVPNCASPTELCTYTGSRVSFEGFVSAEPAEKVDSVTYTVTATTVQNRAVTGKVIIKNRLYPAFAYGDRLAVVCRLDKPVANSDGTFRYDKYLARYGVSTICNNAEIKKIGEGGGSNMLRVIYSFKKYLNTTLATLWPEPEGSLMAGILYGSKNGLPEYLTNDFSRTGVSHIIAVSGFNITIIAVVLMSLLVYFGLYRQQAFYAVVALVIVFTIFSGLSASAIRAAIMGIVVLTAKQVGRSSRIGNVLVLTVAVMQLCNPFLVVWDVGFQLSFLATVGLVYVAPLLESVIPNVREGSLAHSKNKTVRQRFLTALEMTGGWLREPLLTTLAAIITTLPLILYQFGTLSLVAPLVNVLILWCIPWIMLFGFLSLLGTWIFVPLGQFLAFVAHLGLGYVILVVQFFGEKSWASATVPIPLWAMVVMYGALFYIVSKKKSV